MTQIQADRGAVNKIAKYWGAARACALVFNSVSIRTRRSGVGPKEVGHPKSQQNRFASACIRAPLAHTRRKREHSHFLQAQASLAFCLELCSHTVFQCLFRKPSMPAMRIPDPNGDRIDISLKLRVVRALEVALPSEGNLVYGRSLYRAGCLEADNAVDVAPSAHANRRTRSSAILCALESDPLVI